MDVILGGNDSFDEVSSKEESQGEEFEDVTVYIGRGGVDSRIKVQV